MDAMLQAALELLLDRVGGELVFTEAEYAAIRGRRGSYRTRARADKSDPAKPRIVVSLEPAPGRSTDPVM